MNDGPLIVQSDKTLLLEIDHERAADCRKAIAPFDELERSPEHVHTYRITPLSIWNAAAAGKNAEQAKQGLIDHAKYDVPATVLSQIDDFFGRWGKVTLEKGAEEGAMVLVARDNAAIARISRINPDWRVSEA